MSDIDDIQAGAGPAPGDEEAASLRALGMMAATEGAQAKEAQAHEQAQEAAQLMSLEAENEGALMLVAKLATPVFGAFGFPSVAAVLDEQNPAGGTNAEMLAKAWAPVLSKYGVSLGSLGGQYATEISAVLVTVPIAGALWAAVKKDGGRKEKPVPKAAEAAPEVAALA